MPLYTPQKPGNSEFSYPVLPLVAKIVEYDFEDLNASHQLHIPIDPETIVFAVEHIIVTQFAGGTPNLDIGDGDAANGYANDVNPAAAAGTLYNSSAATVTFTAGKYYGSAGDLILTHATGLTAGAARVVILMLPLAKSWREAELI